MITSLNGCENGVNRSQERKGLLLCPLDSMRQLPLQLPCVEEMTRAVSMGVLCVCVCACPHAPTLHVFSASSRGVGKKNTVAMETSLLMCS